MMLLTSGIVAVDNPRLASMLLEALNHKFSPMVFGSVQLTRGTDPSTYVIHGFGKTDEDVAKIQQSPLMTVEILNEMAIFASGYKKCFEDIQEEEDLDE